MPFYEKGKVRLYFEDTGGSGFPLLLVPGGGLSATISWIVKDAPFDPVVELKNEYRCVAADMRHAPGGQSTGPLETDRAWDAYTDDHIALMDHLGIKQFMVMGFCIGGPLVWNLLKRAPDRVVAAIAVQPSGFRPEMPTLSYDNNMKGWGPALVAKRPEITMQMIDAFLKNMYNGRDFLYTVSRDFVRSCQTPVLILPDDVPAHPYAVAMESARLAPRSEVSLYPWKTDKELIRIAVRHIRTFMRAHRPAATR